MVNEIGPSTPLHKSRRVTHHEQNYTTANWLVYLRIGRLHIRCSRRQLCTYIIAGYITHFRARQSQTPASPTRRNFGREYYNCPAPDVQFLLKTSNICFPQA
eukprot:scpid79895/ scgid26843/ 